MGLREKFKVVIIVGVPGVGKTTVTKLMLEKARNEGINIKIVNFGDYMFKAAKNMKLISHRDELRKLPLRTQCKLQLEAAKRIVEDSEKLDKDSFLIIDTHSLIHTVSGYWSGLPLHVIEILKPDMIAVIEASPEDIVKRRMRDREIRMRWDERTLDEIKFFMELARNSALTAGMFVGAAVPIIINKEGRQEEAAIELLSKMKSL